MSIVQNSRVSSKGHGWGSGLKFVNISALDERNAFKYFHWYLLNTFSTFQYILFSQSHAIFRKIWQNDMLPPLQGWRLLLRIIVDLPLPLLKLQIHWNQCRNTHHIQRKSHTVQLNFMPVKHNLLKTAWKLRKLDFTWISGYQWEHLWYYFRSPKVPWLVSWCSVGEKQKNQGETGGWGCIPELHRVQIHPDCSV